MRRALAGVSALLLTLAACSLPPAAAPPAPTDVPLRIESVAVPMTFAREPTQVTLQTIGGELRLRGGGDQLVQGTLAASPQVIQAVLTSQPGTVSILQGGPSAASRDLTGLTNHWDIQLNGATPIQLAVYAGAQRADLDLGGLRLRGFGLNEGPSSTRLNFSTPNPEDMRRMNITTGTSKLEALNLMNAHFASFVFEGGSGEYLLDFGGKAQRAAQVQIRSSSSQMTLRVPLTTGARVSVGSGPAPTVTGGLLADAGGHITERWRRAQELDITVNMTEGTLRVEGTP